MAMRHIESEDGLGKFTQDQNKEKAGLAKLIIEGLRLWVTCYGDIPFPPVAASVASKEVQKIYPEISLGAEWKRQIQRFIELGFHKELGQTEEEYIKGLPKFTPQPEDFKGRLDTPIIVDPRVPIEKQCELIGINNFLEGLKKGDWPDDPKHYTTPKVPYTTWTDEGERTMEKSVLDVRMRLSRHERGGTEFDGISLYIAKPDILKKRFLDLPGTAWV